MSTKDDSPLTADGHGPIEPLSVVLVGANVRGHRHIVQAVAGDIVAFLCGRWQPRANVAPVENLRRHMNTCFICYKAWERLHKERVT